MTATWQSLAPFLCLVCTALCNQDGSNELLWKSPGKDVTIECRMEKEDQDSLSVRTGLTESSIFFVRKDNQKNPLIKDTYKRRLQYHGDFPNMDILIKDLLLNDTGPYWCMYEKFNQLKRQTDTLKGNGSVLLLVSDMHNECPPPNEDSMFLVAITIAAAVLFCILAGLIFWVIFKTKFCCAARPRPAPTNEVYEDMRGTLRH